MLELDIDLSSYIVIQLLHISLILLNFPCFWGDNVISGIIYFFFTRSDVFVAYHSTLQSALFLYHPWYRLSCLQHTLQHWRLRSRQQLSQVYQTHSPMDLDCLTLDSSICQLSDLHSYLRTCFWFSRRHPPALRHILRRSRCILSWSYLRRIRIRSPRKANSLIQSKYSWSTEQIATIHRSLDNIDDLLFLEHLLYDQVFKYRSHHAVNSVYLWSCLGHADYGRILLLFCHLSHLIINIQSRNLTHDGIFSLPSQW